MFLLLLPGRQARGESNVRGVVARSLLTSADGMAHIDPKAGGSDAADAPPYLFRTKFRKIQNRRVKSGHFNIFANAVSIFI